MLNFRPFGLRLAGRIGAGLLAAGLALPALAEYPADRPVQFISPYAAGGANDYLTRLMARYMGESLKANIVVDNKSGANGMIGASAVAKSTPDGYTILMGNSATHGTNPTLYKKQPYDASKDFTPVAMVASVPIVMVVNPQSLPDVTTLPQLIAKAKATNPPLNYTSSGAGSFGHLSMELLKQMAGFDMQHVPYKGGVPAITDTIGGRSPRIEIPRRRATSVPAAPSSWAIASSCTSVEPPAFSDSTARMPCECPAAATGGVAERSSPCRSRARIAAI